MSAPLRSPLHSALRSPLRSPLAGKWDDVAPVVEEDTTRQYMAGVSFANEDGEAREYMDNGIFVNGG
jgi:hypothetical protein